MCRLAVFVSTCGTHALAWLVLLSCVAAHAPESGLGLFILAPTVTVTLNDLVLTNLNMLPPGIFGFPAYAFTTQG